MKTLMHPLMVIVLSTLLLAACGKKEEPVAAEPAPAPVATPAPAPVEPPKEEPGGWVPPAADAAPVAPAETAPATPTVPAEAPAK